MAYTKKLLLEKALVPFFQEFFCSNTIIIVTSCMRAIQSNHQCLFLHRGSIWASFWHKTPNAILHIPTKTKAADRFFWHCFPTKNVGLHSTWQMKERQLQACYLEWFWHQKEPVWLELFWCRSYFLDALVFINKQPKYLMFTAVESDKTSMYCLEIKAENWEWGTWWFP